MNSMSRDYNNPCKSNQPCKKEVKESKSCPTIIKCGTGSSISLPVATPVGTTFNLGSVTVDNSSLCNPVTKIEFSSNIIVLLLFSGTINFQVFKLCKGQFAPTPVGPVWTYNGAARLASADTFSFHICDCNSCFDDCCTYTVVGTTAAIVTVGTLSINNATLTAISTCGSNGCC